MTRFVALIRDALRPDPHREPEVHFHTATGRPEICHDAGARAHGWSCGSRAVTLSGAGQAVAEARPSRKVRTSQGKVVGRPTRGNPRESATEMTPPMAPTFASAHR